MTEKLNHRTQDGSSQGSGSLPFFEPSIAIDDCSPELDNVESARAEGVVWKALVACMAMVAAGAVAPHRARAQTLSATVEHATADDPNAASMQKKNIPSVRTLDLIKPLKDGGMPISSISEMIRVERKTVYSWLDGTEASPENFGRLLEVAKLFKDEKLGALKFYGRFWKRPVTESESLQDVLCAEHLDILKVRSFIAHLRPAVEKSMNRDNGPSDRVKGGAASHLISDLIAI